MYLYAAYTRPNFDEESNRCIGRITTYIFIKPHYFTLLYVFLLYLLFIYIYINCICTDNACIVCM